MKTIFSVLFTFQERPPEADKPMTPHLPAIRGILDLRYQDLSVDDYSCCLDALYLRYPRRRRASLDSCNVRVYLNDDDRNLFLETISEMSKHFKIFKEKMINDKKVKSQFDKINSQFRL